MNAIVPRQTIEDIVCHRNRAVALYEDAFQAIAAAQDALDRASSEWELASPGKPSRVYNSGEEVKAFQNAVKLPPHEEFMGTAKRLIDITVWEHVIRMTKIESLMDSKEVKKLEDQMAQRVPSYRMIERTMRALEDYSGWISDEAEQLNDIFSTIGSFSRQLEDIAFDEDRCSAVTDEDMKSIMKWSTAVIARVKSLTSSHDNWTNPILKSLEIIEKERKVERGLPPVTVDNIASTIEGLMGQSGAIFTRSVVNTFTSLDRRFRSHDGFKIGSRVIFERCFSDFGSWNGYGSNSSQQRIMDIERIFLALDRKSRISDDPNGTADRYMDPASLIWHIDQNRKHKRAQSEIESAFFKVRIFMNGNMHLWMKRKDLLTQVNRILAEHYGEQLGDQMNGGVEDDPLENRKNTPARHYGFFPSPDAVAESVWSKISNYDYRDRTPAVLEPSAGTGALVHEAINRGWDVDCIEVQPHLVADLEQLACRQVTTADFLTKEARPIYDLVVMNPPFDRERDIDHVTHALKFLKPDGHLVAVMSAGTEWRTTKKSKAFQALMTRMNAKWTDLPQGAFSEQGTNVNTVIVSVYKDGRKQSRW